VQVINFRLKYNAYPIVCAAFKLFDAGRIHPVRRRSLREFKRTVDYIESNMPDAIGFETQKEVLDYELA